MFRTAHLRSLTTAASKPRSRFRVVKWTAGTALVVGGSYAVAGAIALQDEGLKKLWVENVPGGQDALDRIRVAGQELRSLDAEKLKNMADTSRKTVTETATQVQTSVNNVYEQASQYADAAQRAVNTQIQNTKDLYSAARDRVDSGVKTVTETYNSAEKTARSAVNTVFATFESAKESVFGKSSSSEAPVATPAAPKSTVPVSKPKVDQKIAAKSDSTPPPPTSPPSSTPATSTTEAKQKPDVTKADTPEATVMAPAQPSSVIDPRTVDVAPEVNSASSDVTSSSDDTAKSGKKKKERTPEEREARRRRKAEKAAAVAAKAKETEAEATITDSIILTLPDLPSSENIQQAVASLEKNLQGLRASPQDTSLVTAARKQLSTLVEYIKTYQSEQHNFSQSILQEHAQKFSEKLRNQVEVSQRALEEQAAALEAEKGRAVEEQRTALIAAYDLELIRALESQAIEFRKVLDNDLRIQALEMERHWQKEVKDAIDLERDGRLARLDHLAVRLKYLERISLEAGDYVHASHSIHRQILALTALQNRLNSGYQLPFSKEFELLRSVGGDDELITTVLQSIPRQTCSRGIATLAELTDSFSRLSRRVRQAQLVPEDGGPVSYVVSVALSSIMLEKSGLVTGGDVESILARSKYYLLNGNLDSATREMNQLSGWPRRLATDWLAQAREHLEVQQAAEVIKHHLSYKMLEIASSP